MSQSLSKSTLGFSESKIISINFLVLFLASTLGYLLVLKTFWFHDDWFFLSNAAGLSHLEKGGSRWISYVGYWKLFFPVFGLSPYGWALTRLLLHAGSTWLVFRLAQRAGLKTNAALLAGFLFAGSPVAFESLYWGTGAVELLGTFFTLASIERWFKKGNRNTILAVLWGFLAIGSKEAGLFLPLLFLAHLVATRNFKAFRLAAVISLGLGALIAGLLLMNNLDSSGEYPLSLASIPHNVLMLFFWLVAPPVWQTGAEAGLPWALASGGILLLAWVGFSIVYLRKGNAFPLQLLFLILLTMGPALVLDNHIVPRYNYGPMAPWVIGVAYFVRKLLPQPRMRWQISVMVIIIATSWWNTDYRIHSRYSQDRPKHRLVAKEEMSQGLLESLTHCKLKENDKLVFFLEPGGTPFLNDFLQDSVGGILGPELFLGRGVKARWTSKLVADDIGAYIISVKNYKVKPLGRFIPREKAQKTDSGPSNK